MPAEETHGVPGVFKEQEGGQGGWNGASERSSSRREGHLLIFIHFHSHSQAIKSQ